MSYVDGDGAANHGGAHDITVPVPAGIADGDLMLAIIGYGPGAATCAGWTQVGSLGGAFNATILTRIASSEPSDYTFAGANGFMIGAIVGYRGPSSVEDSHTQITSPPNPQATQATIASGDGEYVFIAFGQYGAGTPQFNVSSGGLTADFEFDDGFLATAIAVMSKDTTGAGTVGADVFGTHTGDSNGVVGFSLQLLGTGGGGGGISAPTITALTPDSGPVGATVVITGTDLDTVTDVEFNGTPAASFTNDSSTQITAVVDTGTTTGAVVVTNPGGVSSDDPTFTITIAHPPTISLLNPDRGVPGTTVIITGTNFTTATDVSFGLTPATSFNVDSDTQITAIVAPGTAVGADIVTVTNPDGESTDDPTFTAVTGVQIPDGGAGGVRVSIAFDDVTLEPDPTWTDVTALSSSIVAGYDIERGREFELDYTDTGDYTINLFDRDGILDPTNSSSPLYGKIEPDLQVMIELWNPVIGVWSTRFRGWLEDFDYDVDDVQLVQTLTLTCYDIFALLSLVEMQPGEFGDIPPAGSEGNLFFDNATFDGRINQVLGNAGIPSEFFRVFSGNVQLLETIYSPGDTPMNVIQDALDAEFPGVSNGYPDRLGRLAVHGRLAKFDPGTIAAGAGDDAWDFRVWKLGDGAAIEGDDSTVQMRPPYSWNRGRSKIINSALCYPKDMVASDILAQYVPDRTSIGQRGYASWSRENVVIDHGILTGKTGAEECRLFSEFYVANYAEPRNRVTALTLKAIYPLDDRAGPVWQMLCNADIADKVELTVAHPGGGGFNLEPFFIEGIKETCTPADGNFAMVTMSLDVSPAAYFDNPEGLDGS